MESVNRKRQIYTSKTSLFGVFRGELISPKGILESVFSIVSNFSGENRVEKYRVSNNFWCNKCERDRKLAAKGHLDQFVSPGYLFGFFLTFLG